MQVIDIHFGSAKCLDHHTLQLDHPLQRGGDEVGALRVPVEGRVEVGAGVGNHADAPDVELGPRGVVSPRALPREVIADLWRREAGVGGHAVLDDVTQVHDDHRAARLSRDATPWTGR